MPALLRAAAVVATAAALVVAAPVAANAAAPYPPTTTTDWSGAACAGGTFTHTLPSGTFGGSRTLSESITGVGRATPVPGTFLASRTSYSLKSTASGSATVKLTFPSAARGSYDVSIAQQGGGKVSYGAITVDARSAGACATAPTDPATDPAVDPSSTDPVAAAATDPLATTGTYISAGVVGTAAGAVVLGGVLALVAGRRRRSRSREG